MNSQQAVKGSTVDVHYNAVYVDLESVVVYWEHCVKEFWK